MVYSIIEIYKAFIPCGKNKWHSFIPLISIVLGLGLGIAFYFVFPEYVLSKELPNAVVAGAVSGLAATGGDQIFKRLSRPIDNNPTQYCKDETKKEG